MEDKKPSIKIEEITLGTGTIKEGVKDHTPKISKPKPATLEELLGRKKDG